MASGACRGATRVLPAGMVIQNMLLIQPPLAHLAAAGRSERVR